MPNSEETRRNVYGQPLDCADFVNDHEHDLEADSVRTAKKTPA